MYYFATLVQFCNTKNTQDPEYSSLKNGVNITNSVERHDPHPGKKKGELGLVRAANLQLA